MLLHPDWITAMLLVEFDYPLDTVKERLGTYVVPKAQYESITRSHSTV